MGSNQSRPSDAHIQEQLVERLHALQIKDDKSFNEKDGFVYVDNETRT
jgi:bleomycin hydrolase